MADPKRTYYPGPGILDTVDVDAGVAQAKFSYTNYNVPLLRVETGACVLHVECTEGELVALRDMLSAAIGDIVAAAIPVGEATDSDHAALAEIGSAA